MSFFRDKQIKGFFFFVVIYSILLVGATIWFCQIQIAAAKSMFIEHDTAVISSLLEQGVSNEAIATAILNTEVSTSGIELLNFLGIGEITNANLLPYFSQFQYVSFIKNCLFCVVFILMLLVGIFAFLCARNRLFQQASKMIIHSIYHNIARARYFGYLRPLNSLLQCYNPKVKQSIK